MQITHGGGIGDLGSNPAGRSSGIGAGVTSIESATMAEVTG